MKLGEKIIEGIRTRHHDMTPEEATMITRYGDIIFNPRSLHREQVDPVDGNKLSILQSSIQYKMLTNRASIPEIRRQLEDEAKKRLKPYTLNPLKRRVRSWLYE